MEKIEDMDELAELYDIYCTEIDEDLDSYESKKFQKQSESCFKEWLYEKYNLYFD